MILSKPLHFLKFPSLVLENILENLDTIEVNTLSLCSLRTRQALQVFRPVPKNPKIIVNIQFIYEIKIISEGSQILPLVRFPYSSSDTVDQKCPKIEIQNYLNSLKNIPIFEVGTSEFWILEFLKNAQMSSEIVCLQWPMLPDDVEFSEILKSCPNFTKKLFIQCGARKLKKFHEFPKNLDEFFVEMGSWVNIKNLITMDSIHVDIKNTVISSQDVNTFLIYWLAGGFKRLKTIRVGLKSDVQPEQVLRDILDVTHLDRETPMKYQFITNPKIFLNLKGGHRVQRKCDGKVATVFCDFGRNFFMMITDE